MNVWWREAVKVRAKDKHLQQIRSHQATGTGMVVLFLQQFSSVNKQLRLSHAAPSPPMTHSHLGQPLRSQMLIAVGGNIYGPQRQLCGASGRLHALSQGPGTNE